MRSGTKNSIQRMLYNVNCFLHEGKISLSEFAAWAAHGNTGAKKALT